MLSWQLSYLLEIVTITNHEEKNIQSKDEEGTPKICTLSGMLKPLNRTMPIDIFTARP